MAKRKMQVTLTVWVCDLTDEARQSCIDDMGGIDECGALPDLTEHAQEEVEQGWSEVDAGSMAHRLAEHLTPHALEEMFAGSECYATLDEASVVIAEWIGEIEGDRPTVGLVG